MSSWSIEIIQNYLIALSKDVASLRVAQDHPFHTTVMDHRRAEQNKHNCNLISSIWKPQDDICILAEAPRGCAGYHVFIFSCSFHRCFPLTEAQRTWSPQWRHPWQLCSSSEQPHRTWRPAWTWQSPGRWMEHRRPPLSKNNETMLKLHFTTRRHNQLLQYQWCDHLKCTLFWCLLKQYIFDLEWHVCVLHIQ